MSDISELVERFRRSPELLAVVLTGVFGEEEDFTTAPGKWNIRQILAHLADTELVFAHRFRQVIAEENPTLMGFDQDAWARNLEYSKRKPKASLESFRRLRAENHELLKDLPESVFERTGNHTERGTLTLRRMVETAADHAESHARQTQAIRQAYRETKGKK
ncbi:MAG: DinB family protein [Acidobacteriia bacterium]|nr:DinB family protein [Terriglobia bacterium]MBV8905316.1 DinB family protein [Terriglobia bacterium]